MSTTATNTSSPETLRRTIRRLQRRANALRAVSAAVLVVLALAVSQEFHLVAVSLACLVVLAGVFAVGIPTQIALARSRRQLRARLR